MDPLSRIPEQHRDNLSIRTELRGDTWNAFVLHGSVTIAREISYTSEEEAIDKVVAALIAEKGW